MFFKEPLTKILVFSSLLLLLSGCGPASYEECLLEEMRGQQNSMLSSAETVCEREFQPEKNISHLKGQMKFGWVTHRNRPRYEVLENRTDYRVTKAKLKLSDKGCDQLTSREFYLVFSAEFDENGVETHSYYDWPSHGGCIKVDEVFGFLD